MKELRVALAALTAFALLAAPAIADTVHHDGPGSTPDGYHDTARTTSQPGAASGDFGLVATDRSVGGGPDRGFVLITVGERLNK